MKLLKRTWADVSLDDLAHNYHTLRKSVPSSCRFLGVVKADAYGHGAVPISRHLEDLGAEILAISNLEEAVQLRRGGVKTPLLILGYTPAIYAADMVEQGIIQEVHSLHYARELEDQLSGTSLRLSVHLKLDTGMTRLGFFCQNDESALEELLTIFSMKHLQWHMQSKKTGSLQYVLQRNVYTLQEPQTLKKAACMNVRFSAPSSAQKTRKSAWVHFCEKKKNLNSKISNNNSLERI